MKSLYESIFDDDFEPTLDNTIDMDLLYKLTDAKKIEIVNRRLIVRDAYWNAMLDAEFAQFFDAIKGWCSKLAIISDRKAMFPVATDLEGFDIDFNENLSVCVAWNHRFTLKNCKIKTEYFDPQYFDIVGCTIDGKQIDFSCMMIDGFTIDASTQLEATVLKLGGYCGKYSQSNPKQMQNILMEGWKIDTDGPRVTIGTDPIKLFGLKKNFKKYPTYTRIHIESMRTEPGPVYILTNESSIPQEMNVYLWRGARPKNLKQYEIKGSIRPYKYLYTDI